MPNAQQVADRLSQLLSKSRPTLRTTATTLSIQIGQQRREIYLPPQEGQARGIQSR